MLKFNRTYRKYNSVMKIHVSIALFIMKSNLACRQDDDAMRSSLESLQLSDAMHLCSVTMEQVSVNQTQLVAATLSELVPIRAAYLQAFSSQQRVAFHSRYRIKWSRYQI